MVIAGPGVWVWVCFKTGSLFAERVCRASSEDSDATYACACPSDTNGLQGCLTLARSRSCGVDVTLVKAHGSYLGAEELLVLLLGLDECLLEEVRV